MPQDMSPDEALASIREAKAELGRNVDYPIGWDILFGLMIAAMFAGLGIPQLSPALVLLGSLAGLFWMVSWWRNRFGWWVNAWEPKKARWVIFMMWPLLIGCIGLSGLEPLFRRSVVGTRPLRDPDVRHHPELRPLVDERLPQGAG
jgi:hypothetical protein